MRSTSTKRLPWALAPNASMRQPLIQEVAQSQSMDYLSVMSITGLTTRLHTGQSTMMRMAL
jgi:hypothetical protein